MAVEEIELRLTVDGRPAQKALEDTRKQAESLGGRVGNLGEAFKSFQQKLGPSAAAISGVASALGQTNGEAGKALAAAGQVAAAFAAGGPFGAALAAGTYAVDELARSWERQIKAQDAAIQKQYSTFDAIAKTNLELYKQNAALRLQVEPLSPAEIRSQARAEMAKLDAEIQKRQNAIFAAEVNRMRNRFGTDVKALQTETLQLEKQKALLFEQADLRARMLEGRGPTGGARGGGTPTGDVQGVLAKAYADRLQLLQDAGAEIQAAREEQQAVQDAEIDAELDADIQRWATGVDQFKVYEQLKTEILEEENEARAQSSAEAAMAVSSTVAAGLQQFTDDLITGQEHATERFAAFIMQQAGQALVSYGVQAIGRGILEVSSPVTAALAPASFAAGAGLIAAGIGLGGAATGVMHTAAGGTIGQALPTESTSGRASDPGARARPSSGRMGGDSGGQAITIIYGGISGPSADDGARALRRAARRADKRGFA